MLTAPPNILYPDILLLNLTHIKHSMELCGSSLIQYIDVRKLDCIVIMVTFFSHSLLCTG